MGRVRVALVVAVVSALLVGASGSSRADELSDKYGDYPADFVDVLPELEKLGLPTEPVW